MSQESSSRKWLVFLICLVVAAIIVASVAAATIGAGETSPMKLTDPDYPGLIVDNSVSNPGVDQSKVIPGTDPMAPLYGCPNPTELDNVSLIKETEILDYD
jgi:hypothetical protein